MAMMVYFMNDLEYQKGCKLCVINIVNELVTSRDGISWQRSYRSSSGAPPWLGVPSTPNSTRWDARWLMAPPGPVHVSGTNEIRFYYNGFDKGGADMDHIAAVGVATMLVDRYVSISDGGTWGSQGGQITMRPRLFNQTAITLNAQNASGDGNSRLPVEVLDSKGWRVHGLGREDFEPLSNGSYLGNAGLAIPARWRGGKTTLTGIFALRIYLYHTRLYAVDFKGSTGTPCLQIKTDDGSQSDADAKADGTDELGTRLVQLSVWASSGHAVMSSAREELQYSMQTIRLKTNDPDSAALPLGDPTLLQQWSGAPGVKSVSQAHTHAVRKARNHELAKNDVMATVKNAAVARTPPGTTGHLTHMSFYCCEVYAGSPTTYPPAAPAFLNSSEAYRRTKGWTSSVVAGAQWGEGGPPGRPWPGDCLGIRPASH
jgi:hypothetical protein